MDIKLDKNIGEHNNIELRVDYDLGGANYFRGVIDGRGFYLHVKGNNVKIERGFISRSFVLFGSDDKDFKYMIASVKRNNKKRLAELASYLELMDKDE